LADEAVPFIANPFLSIFHTMQPEEWCSNYPGPIIDPFNLLQGVQEFCASILYLVVLCQFLISDAQQDSFEKPRARSRSQCGHFLLLCLSLSFSKFQMESSPLVVGETRIWLGPQLTAYPLLEL
jgi:hypothetical protein